MQIDITTLPPELLEFERRYFLATHPPAGEECGERRASASKRAMSAGKRILSEGNLASVLTPIARKLFSRGVELEDYPSDEARRVEDILKNMPEAEQLKKLASLVREYHYTNAWLEALEALDKGVSEGRPFDRIMTLRRLAEEDGLVGLDRGLTARP